MKDLFPCSGEYIYCGGGKRRNFWWPLPSWAKPLPFSSIPISRFWKVLFFGHFKAPQKCGEEGDCARLLLFPENSKPSGEGGKEAKMKYFPFLSFSTFQRPPYTFSPFPSSHSKNLLPFPFPFSLVQCHIPRNFVRPFRASSRRFELPFSFPLSF